MKSCPKCNTPNSDDTQNCAVCGYAFAAAEAEPKPEKQSSKGDIALPAGYAFKASYQFKNGGYAIYMLLAIAVVFGLTVLGFKHEYGNVVGSSALTLLLFQVLALIVFAIVNLLIRLIVYKAARCGKIHIRLGLRIEIYHEKAIKTGYYVSAQLLTGLLLLIFLIIDSNFAWEDLICALLFSTLAYLLSLIPQLYFLAKQGAGNYVFLNKSSLNVFTKQDTKS